MGKKKQHVAEGGIYLGDDVEAGMGKTHGEDKAADTVVDKVEIVDGVADVGDNGCQPLVVVLDVVVVVVWTLVVVVVDYFVFPHQDE